MEDYKEFFEAESQRDDFSLPDFINKLDNEKLFKFTEYLLTEDPIIQYLFSPSKGFYSDDLAFKTLRELPYATYQKVCNYLEKIFSNALDKLYADNGKTIDNILSLTARRRQGLSQNYIINLLRSAEVSSDMKTDLAILLSKLENTVALSYWDDSLIYEQQPYLIPAYISAFKNADPLKALDKLSYIYKKPENLKYYTRPVTTALENMLIKNREFSSYIELYNKVPGWVKVEFDIILGKGAFARHLISRDIESLRSNKKEIKIGISLFPDLLLLDLASKKGYFTSPQYYFRIEIVDWNNIFQLLIDDQFDFIIGNRDVCNEENVPKEMFKFIAPLIEYKGFSIVFQHEFGDIKTYSELRSLFPDFSSLKILKMTLMQLNKDNIKIFASKNTDHYNALCDLLNLVDLKISDVNVVYDKEPNDGYKLFMSGEVNAIIGGLPQKLLAIENGGKELISQRDFDLPFNQINGLICNKPREGELDPIANKIIHEWNRIIKDIKKNPENLNELVKLYNQSLNELERQLAPIKEKLFKEYWDKTYFLPSKEEIKTLSEDHNRMKVAQEKLKTELAKIPMDLN